MHLALQIFLIVISTLATICSGLVLWNFKQLSTRIEKVESANSSMLVKLNDCKQNCFQTFVEKEDWLREAGNNRVKLDEVSATLNRIDGKLQIMDKLPEICRSIAKEMKGN